MAQQSNARTKHIVTIDGVEMLVVYDKERSVPITALPKRALEHYKRALGYGERSRNVT